jgi:DNA-directed RNA polymerase subunit RPC12/RpoP
MSEAPRPKPPRKHEVFALTCWRCGRDIEVPTSPRPYRCLHCGALLVIEWRDIR